MIVSSAREQPLCSKFNVNRYLQLIIRVLDAQLPEHSLIFNRRYRFNLFPPFFYPQRMALFVDLG